MRNAEEWIQSFTALVEENLENPHLSNTDWAEMLGLSTRQFYRQVIELTGKSPNVFIREIRVKKAVEFIDSGDYRTVKEIAFRVGFLKPSYFSKVYKEYEGVSPREILRSSY